VRSHYRSPISYSDAQLHDARAGLGRLYTALKGHTETAPVDWSEAHAARFKAAMDDDFNTPEAVAVLFEMATRINAGERGLAPQLRALGGLLGLLQRDPAAYFQGGLDAASIETLIRGREAARKRRDFAEADRIRKVLLEQGVVLEDGAGGTTWRRA